MEIDTLSSAVLALVFVTAVAFATIALGRYQQRLRRPARVHARRPPAPGVMRTR
jgi:hypothetical protein